MKRGIALCLIMIFMITNISLVQAGENNDSGIIEENVIQPSREEGINVEQANPLKLNYSQAQLECGKTIQLTLSSNDTTVESGIQWSSSEELIANVDTNGLVTAYKAGQATIKAIQGGYEITCDLTVIEKDIEPVVPTDPPKKEEGTASGPTTPPAVSKWIQNGQGRWYRYADGSWPSNGWKQIEKVWYFFDASGYVKTGWLQSGSKWYYLNASGTMATGWVASGGKWYYMNPSGEMASGWVKDRGKWYYMSSSGTMQTGWLQQGSNWYYLQPSGAMATGWVNSGRTWYFMKGSGAMATGWVKDGRTWYYMSPSGVMQTGWISQGNKWYFLQPSGAMKTGWLNNYGTWYYMNHSGEMLTGWVKADNKWYYMAASGAMKTGWIQLGGVWYYLYQDGHMASEEKVEGYYLDAGGRWVDDIYNVDKKNIKIPGLKRSYKFMVVNDMHIVVPDNDVADAHKGTVQNRQNGFKNGKYARNSSDYWLDIAHYLDFEKANAIIFNGDMVDYYSNANNSRLQKGFSSLSTPSMYLKADHDVSTLYSNYSTAKKEQIRQASLKEDNIKYIEYEDLIIVGFNMSTSQLTPSGLTRAKELFAKGKPVILVSHVPLNSKVDNSLYNSSLASWGNKALLWGDGCAQVPNGVTKEFLDMVYNDTSPVAAVIGAHLHYAHTSKLTNKIPEYVFAAAFQGNVGELDVSA
ncbi:MAG: hypothetical protein EOM40_17790 [Clostridia bacterium]|nr:hypothetical protein [Clostridia bacterium]